MTERFYFDEGLDATPAQQSGYQEAVEEYHHHVELLVDLVLEATAYANYISDLVRAELDPEFRASEEPSCCHQIFDLFLIRPFRARLATVTP